MFMCAAVCFYAWVVRCAAAALRDEVPLFGALPAMMLHTKQAAALGVVVWPSKVAQSAPKIAQSNA